MSGLSVESSSIPCGRRVSGSGYGLQEARKIDNDKRSKIALNLVRRSENKRFIKFSGIQGCVDYVCFLFHTERMDLKIQRVPKFPGSRKYFLSSRFHSDC